MPEQELISLIFNALEEFHNVTCERCNLMTYVEDHVERKDIKNWLIKQGVLHA